MKPRTGARKAGETAVDLTLLALAIPVGFDLLRLSTGWQIPHEVETRATALLVAVGGVVARWARHRMLYGRDG